MSKLLLKHSGGNGVSLNPPTSAPGSSEVAFKLPGTDGSANQLLKTDGSGNLGWADDANASRTLLSTTTLSGTSTSTSITKTGYHSLEGVGYNLDTTGSNTGDMWLRINGDTGSNYHWAIHRQDHAGSPSHSAYGGISTSGFFFNNTGSSGFTNGNNQSNFFLYNINESGVRVNYHAINCGDYSATSGKPIIHTAAFWDSTAAITSLSINTSNTMDGGTLKVWGVK